MIVPLTPMTSSASLRRERADDWARLDGLLRTAERKSVRALSDEELLAIPVLYRATLSSLAVARETSLDRELIAYLEGLSVRAYFFVYGVRTSLIERLRDFFARDWPMAVRSLWRETLVALALLMAGIIAGAILVALDPAWYDSFVPRDLAGGRDASASTASLRATLYERGGGGLLAVFATYLFAHNTQVAILAFALGMVMGMPTALLLLSTGCMVGAFFALFASHGLGFELAGWLLIHGSTELFAIILAGAAGLRIGWRVAFPGTASRATAAREAGRVAATAMVGVMIMLFLAGGLEGIGRQTVVNDGARYAIAAAMLAFWLGYFYLGGRRRGV